MMNEKLVNKRTRAKRFGTMIKCPECNFCDVSFHFSWNAITCMHCGADVEKNRWIICGHCEAYTRPRWYMSSNGTPIRKLSSKYPIPYVKKS